MRCLLHPLLHPRAIPIGECISKLCIASGMAPKISAAVVSECGFGRRCGRCRPMSGGGSGCEEGFRTAGRQEQGNERQRNGSAIPPAGRSSMTELAFFPRVCCSFVGHGCDFEGETEFRCKRNSSEFRPEVKQSEAYSGQPAQPALRHHASQGAVLVNLGAAFLVAGQTNRLSFVP